MLVLEYIADCIPFYMVSQFGKSDTDRPLILYLLLKHIVSITSNIFVGQYV